METNQEQIIVNDLQLLLTNAASAFSAWESEQAQVAVESDKLLDGCLNYGGVLRDWAEELSDVINSFSELRIVLNRDLHGLEILAQQVEDGTLPEEPIGQVVADVVASLTDGVTRSAGIVRGLVGLMREVVERATSVGRLVAD